MTNPIIIFGAKGLGRVAQEIFKSHDLMVYGFLDDDKEMHGQEIDFVTVLGDTDDQAFLKLIGHKCDAFVAHDDNAYRRGLVEMLISKRKVMPINAIHQQAHLALSAQIGHGNFISAGAQIGANASIGSHCLIHAKALIDYEAEVQDFAQIGAGSIINSGVKIAEEAFIGAGCTIISGVSIGKKARIGAGSVVIADVKAGQTVFGNPAQVVKS
jgi:sugar O-acyltransferase (sialic acid O-acetyltransferase NeuD family)